MSFYDTKLPESAENLSEGDRIRMILSTLSGLGFEISEEQAGRFARYYDMLVEKNKVMNLTRITDFRDALEKHFADSLMIAGYLDMKKVTSILDLGSGAGFPGIPLKIMYPDIDVLMIDSVGKKMQFVSDVISDLGLEGASAMHVRAEDLARDKNYREKYDLCVSRAVANLSTLSEYCLPFVKKGGTFAAYKAANCEEEVLASGGAVRKLGGGQVKTERFDLFEMGRAIVLCQKLRPTPGIYPRKAGVPAKSPLA